VTVVLARAFAIVLVVAIGVWSQAAMAGALDAAKAAGQVGERIDGYVGIVDANAPAEVKALVADINAKRRAKYEQIAADTGTTLTAVEVIVGQKLIARAKPGEFVTDQSGRWVRK